jgi:DNA repair ATPase RecN
MNKINELQQIVDDCSAKREEIQLAKERIDRHMSELKYELKRLQEDYPRILAIAALDETQDDDPKECRRLIQNIKQDLADIPLTQQELSARFEKLMEKGTKASRQITIEESRLAYNKLKPELLEKYRPGGVPELRRLANNISAYGDIQKRKTLTRMLRALLTKT